jgi:hypothetical protein
MDPRSDDVAGENIDHHVAVVVLALDRASQFCDVPRIMPTSA